MPRYRLTVAYDGRPFHGWQRQKDCSSVQETLEDAVFIFARVRVEVAGGGRTDAGVHAERQGAHIDLPNAVDPFRLCEALNGIMKPAPVAVLEAEEVDDRFHARFSAVGRDYRYRILNRRAPPTVERGFVWHVARPLNVDAMAAAAKRLEGRHDFTSFRSTHCQADSPVKTLDALRVTRDGDEIHVYASARSFLHNQVRIMTGALASVGLGKRDSADIDATLAARDRRRAPETAPSDGLTLLAVRY